MRLLCGSYWGHKSEVIRTPTDDFGDRHTNQLILRSLNKFIK